MSLAPEPDLTEQMPRLFAADLAGAPGEKPRAARMVLLLDTHETFFGEAVAEPRALPHAALLMRDEWLCRLLGICRWRQRWWPWSRAGPSRRGRPRRWWRSRMRSCLADRIRLPGQQGSRHDQPTTTQRGRVHPAQRCQDRPISPVQAGRPDGAASRPHDAAS